MATLQNALSKSLKALHQPHSPIIFTNIYDGASAKAVASLSSAKALATASYAVAAAAGLDDDDLTMDINITAVKQIASAIKENGKPLSVDFQDGYGDQLEDGITQLLQLGVAGINLEDYDNSAKAMYSPSAANSRIRKVLEVARIFGVPDFVVNARCDTFLHGGSLEETIQRGQQYLEAGATTVFVLGGPHGISRAEVKALVEAFDGRLSVMLKLSPDGLTTKQLADIGVARISIGPTLQIKAMASLKQEAESILTMR